MDRQVSGEAVAHRAAVDSTVSSLHGTYASDLFPAPPNPSCEIVVVIPARNEQETIARTLESLASQTTHSGSRLSPAQYEVLVLINNTTDLSRPEAERIQRRHPAFHLQIAEINLPEESAHVGQARRMLMDVACERLLSLGRPLGIIATTDADTVVDSEWIAGTINAIRNGADAVGGRILVQPDELATMDLDTRGYHLRDVGYRYLLCQLESTLDPHPGDPWPRHFQHFGASIALTAAAYRAIGGLPVRPSLEDVALYHRLVRIDATVRHCPNVRVFTSARPQGRTSWGFATQLQQWAGMNRHGEPFLVRSADDMIDEYRAKRALRRAYARFSANGTSLNGTLESLAEHLVIRPGTLSDVFYSSRSFGELWQTIHNEQAELGERATRFPRIEIERAIRDLRQLGLRHKFSVSLTQPLEHVESVEVLPSVSEMC
jgi:GT2 family glycosyltransferase